jgi:predicted transcriptional regulator
MEDHTTMTFRCPADLVELVDADAAKSHRTRSGMLISIIAERYAQRPTQNGSKPTAKKTTKKKASVK